MSDRNRNSVYREQDAAVLLAEFNMEEVRHCRVILRRLRFLEEQITRKGGMQSNDPSGGAVFVELEANALAWMLTDIGFIKERGEA